MSAHGHHEENPQVKKDEEKEKGSLLQGMLIILGVLAHWVGICWVVNLAATHLTRWFLGKAWSFEWLMWGLAIGGVYLFLDKPTQLYEESQKKKAPKRTIWIIYIIIVIMSMIMAYFLDGPLNFYLIFWGAAIPTCEMGLEILYWSNKKYRKAYPKKKKHKHGHH